MATLASTNITTAVTYNSEAPLAYGASGLQVEVFRAAGGAVADTVAITPRYSADIRSVLTEHPTTNNLSSTAANTNVTLTLTASAATSTTFDVWLLVKRSTV